MNITQGIIFTIIFSLGSLGCSTTDENEASTSVENKDTIYEGVDKGKIGLSYYEPTSDVIQTPMSVQHVLFPDGSLQLEKNEISPEVVPPNIIEDKTMPTLSEGTIIGPEMDKDSTQLTQKINKDPADKIWEKYCNSHNTGAVLTEDEQNYVDTHPLPEKWNRHCVPTK